VLLPDVPRLPDALEPEVELPDVVELPLVPTLLPELFVSFAPVLLPGVDGGDDPLVVLLPEAPLVEPATAVLPPEDDASTPSTVGVRLSSWPIATADNSSSGHFAMEAIAKAPGAKYRHVTYDGGKPAVVATIAGEVEVTRAPRGAAAARIVATGWVAFGVVAAVAWWQMERLESLHFESVTAPGLAPSTFGLLLAMFGALLLVRRDTPAADADDAEAVSLRSSAPVLPSVCAMKLAACCCTKLCSSVCSGRWHS
jgi:hypothetical protein